MSSQPAVRRATHAGSWYVSSAKDLNNQLDNWLNMAGEPNHAPARAVIAPHAGYQYCGACAAYAYKQVDPTFIKRVFILGPSHHVRLSGCALSPVRVYRTPLRDLTVDQLIYDELYSTGQFEEMTLLTDEDEHSIEMHLPYVAKVMENRDFTIVPVMVGSLSTDRECVYGKIFSKYLADPSNLFVISSDFCHWGARFHYQYYDKSWGQIYQSIEKLDEMISSDREEWKKECYPTYLAVQCTTDSIHGHFSHKRIAGMNIIEELSPTGFTSYLKKFGNTICGRHPIGVLLNAVHSLQQMGNGIKPSLKFLKYAQSSKCLNSYDSSVSYAAASLVIA